MRTMQWSVDYQGHRQLNMLLSRRLPVSTRNPSLSLPLNRKGPSHPQHRRSAADYTANQRLMKTNRTAIMLGIACVLAAQPETSIVWRHLSTKAGDLPAPNSGTQQTSATVFDIDKDG